MIRKGFLVCFAGVDGSGKTTHAKSLKKYLEKQDYSCIYVWGAFRPYFSYLFFIFTRSLGYWKYTKRDAYTDPLEYAPKHLLNKLGKIWRLFIFFDYQLKIFTRIRLPLIFGKVVICDRYFYDLLMELKLSNISSKNFDLLLPKTVPRALVTFLLDAPESLASRRRDFPEDFFFGRRRVLLEFATSFDFVIIDSRKDLSENQQEIREELLRRLSG
jgi:dTMP kinase